MWPLVLTSLVTVWEAVVPGLLAPSMTSLVDLLSLFSTLSKAHLGYLHLVRAFLRLSFSCWSISGLLHTVWALWERVCMTLNLAERWWWLSHCQYWSVCVGFLYTVMDSSPSASGLTMVSKKGMEPSSLLSSTVKLMAGSTPLMCWRKPCLLASLWMTKVSSTNLHQNLGAVRQYLELFVLSTPYKGWLQWSWLRNPWQHPQPIHRTGLGKRSMCFWDKTPIGEWCLQLTIPSFPWGCCPFPIDPLWCLGQDLLGLRWTGQTHHRSWGIPQVPDWCLWPVQQSLGCYWCGVVTCKPRVWGK